MQRGQRHQILLLLLAKAKSLTIRVATKPGNRGPRREDHPGIARLIIGPHFLDLSTRLLLGLQKFQQSCRDWKLATELLMNGQTTRCLTEV
jgi:hypothetical protein